MRPTPQRRWACRCNRTGSGIADLEIEREKAAIAKGEIEAEEAATAPFGDVIASGGE